ncbi:Predicted PurR-regulated permease PerM [Clostridium intestinale DSM 6191]|uniref:Predicted PurR-regulated permease PerM n=1 Tax=Clostridium intestinale DSM 6191 TaxID=1121320 RepID=A0A1M5WIT7_9CLOT|nr:Predicted PurR-regulated permease PerM [Clostridium intestinale DSM 6191]
MYYGIELDYCVNFRGDDILNFIERNLTSNSFKKALALVLLIAALFLLKDFMSLILLTLIEVILILDLSKTLYKKARFKRIFTKRIVDIISYFLVVLGLIGFLVVFIPNIANQVNLLINGIKNYDFSEFISKFDKYNLDIKEDTLMKGLSSINVLTMKAVGYIKNTGFNIGLSILLSFMYILEQHKLKAFFQRFETGKGNFLYTYYKSLAKIFMKSFVVVIEMQLVISLINAIISSIILTLLGFENVFILGPMMFILGLMPVVGVIVSFIPLSICALQIGGISKLISVVVMIIVLHAFESYVLNPKIMSSAIHLPIFITFTVLILSEHFLGAWGMIIGIPLFVFILELVNGEREEIA